jgi:transcriptional regulator with XRE-family HTH domain
MSKKRGRPPGGGRVYKRAIPATPGAAVKAEADVRFAAKLDRTFAESGVVAASVARALGVDPTKVAKWRRGDGMPRADQVVHLARMLGVSVEYLCDPDLETDPNPPPEHQSEQERLARSLFDDMVRTRGAEFALARLMGLAAD